MPKDDGEFYQFCYVAASGHVRGASPPFQFKHPMTDDLIEIEDENGELLVIRTKTVVLEDQLKKANETRAELKQVSVFYLQCAITTPQLVILLKFVNSVYLSHTVRIGVCPQNVRTLKNFELSFIPTVSCSIVT